MLFAAIAQAFATESMLPAVTLPLIVPSYRPVGY
jgi:hypothetical protein